MPSENDPFEMLRRKLEAKKKGGQAAQPAKPAQAPAQKPAAAQKPGQGAPAPVQARPSMLAAQKQGAADPSTPPMRLQKSLFAAEDLKKMARTTEKVSGDVPENFETHRFDTEVDPESKKVVKKKSVTRVQKPKGFKSDRFDRG